MNKLLIYLFSIFILVTASTQISIAQEAEGFSGTTSVNMPSPDDNSNNVLGTADATNENIGTYIIDWVLRGASFTSPENTLFGSLSLILNATVLAFTLVVLAKHGLQFATLTATKGVPGGSQLSGGVVTVRAALAVSMLTPIIGNGFSPIQATLQEATRFGAYIGDQATSAATSYLSGDDINSGTASINPIDLKNTTDLIWSIVLSEACLQAATVQDIYDSNTSNNNSDDLTVFTIHPVNEKLMYQWGWKEIGALSQRNIFGFSTPFKYNACGGTTLTIPTPLFESSSISINEENIDITIDSTADNQKELELYKLQVETHHKALLRARQRISPLINALFSDQVMLQEVSSMRYAEGSTTAEIQSVYEAINKKSKAEIYKIPSVGAELFEIDKEFKNTIKANGNKAAEYIKNNGYKDSDGRTWDESLSHQGFAALGAYYWIQLKVNLSVADLQSLLLKDSGFPNSLFGESSSAKLFDPDNSSRTSVIKQSEFFKSFIDRLALLESAYKNIVPNENLDLNLDNIKNVDQIGEVGDSSSIWSLVGLEHQPGYYLLDGINKTLVNNTNNDLIINISNFGIFINAIFEIVLAAFIALLLATKTPVIGAVTTVLTGGGIGSVLTKIVVPILAVLFLIGMTFQYLLPALPMIKWIVALQSWSIMMFIAMIYGPIWMMSAASATNEDWVNGKTQEGFVVLAELILRPLLMVAGFYAAQNLMAVANIGAKLAFSYFIGIANEGAIGIIGIIAVIGLSGYVAYQMITRTFDLIFELPEAIISRMGGTPSIGRTAGDDPSQGSMVVMTNIQQSGAKALSGIKPVPPVK